MRHFTDDEVTAAALAAIASFPSSVDAKHDAALAFYAQFLRAGMAILTAKRIMLDPRADALLRDIAGRPAPDHVRMGVARAELQRKGLLAPQRGYALGGNRCVWVLTALGHAYLNGSA